MDAIARARHSQAHRQRGNRERAGHGHAGRSGQTEAAGTYGTEKYQHEAGCGGLPTDGSHRTGFGRPTEVQARVGSPDLVAALGATGGDGHSDDGDG